MIQGKRAFPLRFLRAFVFWKRAQRFCLTDPGHMMWIRICLFFASGQRLPIVAGTGPVRDGKKKGRSTNSDPF